ncbi:hypothetical protein ABW19_dt0200785 [Dactylella cylindrospora]|nr:hypothetical protein ABW19_dt0200785 [Dactylella cylindrospora]
MHKPILDTPTPMTLRLEGENTKIVVDGSLEISFRRTIKVPDNEQISNLPPDLGAMKLTNVAHVASRLPPTMGAKGGLLLPMHENEAMWIDFENSDMLKKYAIKIFIGGVNAISGEPEVETAASKLRRRNLLSQGKTIQDYVVVPDQPWLDGIAVSNGTVRQFVATSLGQGLTVEAQITGSEDTGGLQFEITPAVLTPDLLNSEDATFPLIPVYPRPEGPVFTVFVKTLTGRTYQVKVNDDWQIGAIKEVILEMGGVPPDQQRLIFAGKQLEDDRTIGDYKIQNEATIQQVLRLRGGGDPKYLRRTGEQPVPEMGLAAGGTISQTIHRDNVPASLWQRDRTIGFNVQILNSALYSQITSSSSPPPNLPQSAQSYANSGGNFFKIDETPSGVFGQFQGVQSIGTLTGKTDKPVVVPTRKIWNPFSKFSSFHKKSKSKPGPGSGSGSNDESGAAGGDGKAGDSAPSPSVSDNSMTAWSDTESMVTLVESTEPSSIASSPRQLSEFRTVREMEEQLGNVGVGFFS